MSKESYNQANVVKTIGAYIKSQHYKLRKFCAVMGVENIKALKDEL